MCVAGIQNTLQTSGYLPVKKSEWYDTYFWKYARKIKETLKKALKKGSLHRTVVGLYEIFKVWDYLEKKFVSHINPPMPEFFITREMGFVGVSIGKRI